ncbi:MAG: hypothetical protein BWY82_00086 [Verrucomicrobia bacterium ADurb.Bin474]|nr:MAG: hypothetical protein BWY82_00086 [Verrucomicrobia bacterium ADurb.Bin474]
MLTSHGISAQIATVTKVGLQSEIKKLGFPHLRGLKSKFIGRRVFETMRIEPSQNTWDNGVR